MSTTVVVLISSQIKWAWEQIVVISHASSGRAWLPATPVNVWGLVWIWWERQMTGQIATSPVGQRGVGPRVPHLLLLLWSLKWCLFFTDPWFSALTPYLWPRLIMHQMYLIPVLRVPDSVMLPTTNQNRYNSSQKLSTWHFNLARADLSWVSGIFGDIHSAKTLIAFFRRL